MKILLTGATGYIGKRLLPELLKAGHEVICCVRDSKRFNPSKALKDQVQVLQLDLLDKESLLRIPSDIDGAFYLVHSMSASSAYEKLEQASAINFREALMRTKVDHLVYLSGIVNENTLSKHLSSRKTVEMELSKGSYNFTTLRAGIIIGSGSASFEIIRDLVEKLPLMITPQWLNTKCQPIGVSDVISFLSKSIFNTQTYNKDFDIGGPNILSYKEMLLEFGQIRKLKRRIYTVPVMTPKLSSYWLYFVTSTSYKLATALVSSMKIEVVCRNTELNDILGITPVSYKEALAKAFVQIENNEILSSWKDAFSGSGFSKHIAEFEQVPIFGCFIDKRVEPVENTKDCIERIWRIGGSTGWYAANFLWGLRGILDKILGGVGLRRGRTNKGSIHVGDALDFWRVLYADKDEGRLLLFAEMKLPGEAWLEFKVKDNKLTQTATFRPLGLAGRMYWYLVLPFHGFIFRGMIKKIATGHN